jgi:hypothetical protein
MQLEARALEPLDCVGLPFDQLLLRVAERQAEQRQALGRARTAFAVELQAAGAPGRQDRAADVVAGLGEELAYLARRRSREGHTVAALLIQAIRAEPAQQHVVGARVGGVQLQAGALEPLHLRRLAFDALLLLWPDREAEYRQPAVLFPKLADAPSIQKPVSGKQRWPACAASEVAGARSAPRLRNTNSGRRMRHMRLLLLSA